MLVLVTDGNQRSTLALTRSLGRRGVAVLVGDAATSSLASSSRYCRGHVVYPSPYRDPEEFYRFLLQFVQTSNVDVLIPVTDVTTRIVASHRDELAKHVRFVIPDLASFDFVTDKWSLLKYAQQLSIPVPLTRYVEGPQDVPKILGGLRYPAVVKPSRSWIHSERGWTATRVHYVNSEPALLRLYRETEFLRYPSLVQEQIVGPGLGVFLLFNRGTLVAVFGHRRLRELPPSGGISVLRESVRVDPCLRDSAVRLLGQLRWHGVAMVEYKLDRERGTPFLMEVNGRFWGSLQLAIDAGIDFPYLLYQIATGNAVQPSDTYRVGVKSRWLLGDLLHLLRRVGSREKDLHLPPGSPSRLQTVMSFLKFYDAGLRYEDVSSGDPCPLLFDVFQRVKNAVGKRRADG